MTTYIEVNGVRKDILDYVEQLEDEIARLKAELERPRGDGYSCANGCAHCCSAHYCDCYN